MNVIIYYEQFSFGGVDKHLCELVNNWKNKEIIGSDPVRNNEVRIEVVSPHMYDPEGDKMYG